MSPVCGLQLYELKFSVWNHDVIRILLVSLSDVGVGWRSIASVAHWRLASECRQAFRPGWVILGKGEQRHVIPRGTVFTGLSHGMLPRSCTGTALLRGLRQATTNGSGPAPGDTDPVHLRAARALRLDRLEIDLPRSRGSRGGTRPSASPPWYRWWFGLMGAPCHDHRLGPGQRGRVFLTPGLKAPTLRDSAAR